MSAKRICQSHGEITLKNMSSIHKGKFNQKLKRTGFLSQPKMEARLIARHPRRFLENYADRKIHIMSSANGALEEFIDQVKGAGDYERKEGILKRKVEDYKNRALILSLASSSPGITKSPGDGGNYFTMMNPLERLNEKDTNYEEIIDNFLMDIKMAEKEHIENWIHTCIQPSEMKLPYGLPHNLRMPLDSTTIRTGDDDDGIQTFIDNSSDEFLLLDGEYHTKIEEISTKISENHEEITSKSGWTIGESALLFYVIITVLEESPTPLGSNLQIQLTRRLFPQRSREEIIAHKYRLRTKRILEEKRANIVRDWLRDKEELQTKINAAWGALHESRVRKLEKSLKIRKQKEICLHWAALLSKMRRVKSERVKRIQTLAQPVLEKQHNMERLRCERETQRRRTVKSAAETFRGQKTEERLEEMRKKEEVDKIIQRMKETQLKNQKPRVKYRQAEFEQKRQVRKAQEEEAQRLREQRAALLEKIKEKPEIDYDPANILVQTHATRVRQYETYLENTRRREGPSEVDMVKFFREQYSFSAESIWGDRRLRVESKLREAGLMDSSYARQVLLAMQPAHKPHLMTQIKFNEN